MVINSSAAKIIFFSNRWLYQVNKGTAEYFFKRKTSSVRMNIEIAAAIWMAEYFSEWITLAISDGWQMARKWVLAIQTDIHYVFMWAWEVKNWNYTKKNKHYCCIDQAYLRCLVNLQLFRHTFLYKQETRKNHEQNEPSE